MIHPIVWNFLLCNIASSSFCSTTICFTSSLLHLLFRQPSELFETFDPEPLGAASLAQVHRATLKNGSVVAVKVQHHYVRGNSKVDMNTMEIGVKIMSWLFPDFKFQWLVEESKKNLPIELDFLHEGKNTEKVSNSRKNISKFEL